jgi:5-methylcytosine-specific restriction endonuclease McrA
MTDNMNTVSIAIKHLIAAGADAFRVQAFVEDVASYLDAVYSADRDREARANAERLEYNENYEATRKRAYRLKKNIIARDGEQCRYCGTCVGPFHIDHVVPQSRGGESNQDNLVVSCINCNLKKGNKTLEELGWNLRDMSQTNGTKESTKENNIYNITPGEGECEGENPLVPETGTQRRTKNILEQRFLEFWCRYPKKSGKGAARAKFMVAIKKATSTQIMEGLEKYIASKPDPQFTKNPATWLHQECWLDEYDKPKGVILAGPWKEVKPEAPQKPMTPEEKARREEQIARLRPGSIKDTLRKSLDRGESFEEDRGE